MSQIISLTLPVLISGLTLIIVIKFKLLEFLDVPIDHGLLLNKKRLFGNNKTYRGLIIFVTISILISAFLRHLYLNGYQNHAHPIFSKSPILIGSIYALAYTCGELINSAIKRQLSIKPGETVMTEFKKLQQFVDLSDGIIMVAAMLTIFTLVTAYQALAASALGIGIHLGTDKLMESLGLKQEF